MQFEDGRSFEIDLVEMLIGDRRSVTYVGKNIWTCIGAKIKKDFARLGWTESVASANDEGIIR